MHLAVDMSILRYLNLFFYISGNLSAGSHTSPRLYLSEAVYASTSYLYRHRSTQVSVFYMRLPISVYFSMNI